MSAHCPMCEQFIMALKDFDRATAPLGLYACEEFRAKDRPYPRLHQEWHLCLQPLIRQLGGQTGWGNIREGEFQFSLSEGVRLKLLRTSKIKVRKFGSHYRVDRQQKFQERWAGLRLDRALSDLWKPSSLAQQHVGLRVVLFIGFAQEDDPFRKELASLHAAVNWDEHKTNYTTEAWEDGNGRNFNIKVCCWSRASDERETNAPLDNGGAGNVR